MHTLRAYYCFFLLFFIFEVSGIEVFSQNVIKFNTLGNSVSITEQAYFFSDPKNEFSIAQVLSDSGQLKFKPSSGPRVNFGLFKGSVWCKMIIENQTQRVCFLQIPQVLIGQIEVFKKEDTGEYVSQTFGSRYSMAERDIQSSIFYHRLVEEASGPDTVYIRFQSDIPLELSMSIGTMESCLKLERAEKGKVILLGILVAMLVYNLFVSFMIKERAYAYYVLYLFFATLMVDMLFTGFGFQYIWPETPEINLYISAIAASSFVFLGLFTASFLSTKTTTPALHKGLILMHALAFAVIIANLTGAQAFANSFILPVMIVYSTYVLVIGYAVSRKGQKMAVYFLVACSVSLATIILNVLYAEHILLFPVPLHTIMIGLTLEAVLFGFAMAHKMRLMRKEKELAQQEKLILMREQNLLLEKKVQERTEEIASQNEEISAQNEQLVYQQEQINLQNNELQQKNQALDNLQKLLHLENTELKKYSGSLEDLISERAKDLIEVNEELMVQNRQLEQFAFIIAHNLRAPVARVQGLINIMSYHNSSPDENEFVLEKINESIVNLDTVIRDLIRILEVRKGSAVTFEMVSMQDKVDLITAHLQPELLRINAKVQTNFNEAPFIFTQPQYIESILFHLITNAIKFRALHRDLIIEIRTSRDKNGIKLYVRDNGMGIDLQTYGDKLFGLYQRFHHHVQGKGLGLHLVKLQTEALGGTTEATSDGESGTTFIITIPHKSAN